jgi:hypothetical protein
MPFLLLGRSLSCASLSQFLFSNVLRQRKNSQFCSGIEENCIWNKKAIGSC